MKIGLIGDYDANVPAHQAIPLALDLASKEIKIEISFDWVPTDEIQDISRVKNYDGLWCVPASPYKNMEGALLAIQYARENNIPFLGTCGGFQHAIIEYARHVLGWHDADHAETAPNAKRLIISPLTCSLIEESGQVHFVAGSKIEEAYSRYGKSNGTIEKYRCNFGLNHEFEKELTSGALCVCGLDGNGKIRALELKNHPFFIVTLFQHERAALNGEHSPLTVAFLSGIKNLRLAS